MCLCARMLALELKGGAFIEKVNSRCFCWFPAAILVDSFCPPIWRLHTKLYKGAWNVSATNSETVGHKDLRFGQIVYILVFYNISFSWLLSLDGFKCIFLCRVYCVTVKTKNSVHFHNNFFDESQALSNVNFVFSSLEETRKVLVYLHPWLQRCQPLEI